MIPEDVISTMRGQLRLGLAASTMVPPDKLDEIVDLAVHAARSGFETTMRIAQNTSPDARVGLTTTGPALSLLAFFVESGINALKDMAREAGRPHGEFQIRTGGTVQ